LRLGLRSQPLLQLLIFDTKGLGIQRQLGDRRRSRQSSNDVYFVAIQGFVTGVRPKEGDPARGPSHDDGCGEHRHLAGDRLKPAPAQVLERHGAVAQRRQHRMVWMKLW